MGPLQKLVLTFAMGLGSTSVASQFQNVDSDGGPSVGWSTSDGASVVGKHSLTAFAAPDSSGTSQINKVCLTQDGSPVVSSTSNTNGYTNVSFTYGLSSIGNGCFSTSSYSSGTTLNFYFDSTTWKNGSRTYAITVTDTVGRTATSNTITVNHQNPQPAVSVKGFELRTSGLHLLELGATLAGVTDQWALLCVVNPSKGIVVLPSGWIASTNSCWTPSRDAINSSSIVLTLDTLKSEVSLHSLNLELRDSVGRKGSILHEFSWDTPKFGVEILGIVPDTRVTGTINLAVQTLLEPEIRSRVTIAEFCLKVKDQPCAKASTVGLNEIRYVLDTAQYSDGNQVLVATIKDSLGRSGTRSFPIMIANGLPIIGDVQFLQPIKVGGSTKSVEIVIGISRASSATLRYRDIKSKKSIIVPLSNAAGDTPEIRLAISGLTIGKTYAFEVSAKNANGRAISKQWRYKVKSG